MYKWPRYLEKHRNNKGPGLAISPRQAALDWFGQARYGLFLHFGLYSLLGRHEWVQCKEKIRPGDYAQLAHAFKADGFDAGAIADFALACGMRYVNITTRHHDGFCLWPSHETTFHVGNTPCGRDLLGELAEACEGRGLGLFLYYSHGRDWKHPHAPNNDRWGGSARPAYDPPEPTYAVAPAHDLAYYTAFVMRQITELLTDYPTAAGIWLDGIGVPLSPKDAHGRILEGFDPRTDGDAFACQALYDQIHKLSPHALVSYKQGYLGTEDFFAPEHKAHNRFGDATGKPMEICTTSGGGWGYTAGNDYFSIEALREQREQAGRQGCNLLINVGPLPNGALPQQPCERLRQA